MCTIFDSIDWEATQRLDQRHTHCVGVDCHGCDSLILDCIPSVVTRVHHFFLQQTIKDSRSTALDYVVYSDLTTVKSVVESFVRVTSSDRNL